MFFSKCSAVSSTASCTGSFWGEMTEREYGKKVRSEDSPRVFLCLLFLRGLLYSLLVETEENIIYGLLVPLTDNVHLIALLCARGEFMGLVFEGVLSHPSICYGPCIFSALSYCQECILQPCGH